MASIPLLLLLIIGGSFSQKLFVTTPSQLMEQFGSNGTAVHVSPLGYKPQSGWLHGKVSIASPESACSTIQPISEEQNEDIFLFADDTGCLESIKAKNLAEAGAYIGVIKKNIKNTLHDREVNLVHIPIIELDPEQYNKIISHQKQNPNITITMIVDFSKEDKKRIQLEFWMTPTEKQSYNFILSMKDFINHQPQDIAFQPRFVFHSQVQRKQYVGCYSSGKYCPAELQFQGKKEGTKVVSEALRQIIIAEQSVENWFNYAFYYYHNCLSQENIWISDKSDICSENAMALSGINYGEVKEKFNSSFLGPIHQIDQNLVLQEQRQLYIFQQITKYPSILINKKQQTKLDPQYIQRTICFKMHPDPTKQSSQCQKLTNPSSFHYWQILVIVGVVVVLMLSIMAGYRGYVHYRMKRQMKGEVDKTLQQYYKYMETFEDDGSLKKPLEQVKEPEVKTNQIGSIELSEMKQK